MRDCMMKRWQDSCSMHERQVARIVLPDARMRVLATEPVLKLGKFGVHGGLLFDEEFITQVAKSLYSKASRTASNLVGLLGLK